MYKQYYLLLLVYLLTPLVSEGFVQKSILFTDKNGVTSSQLHLLSWFSSKKNPSSSDENTDDVWGSETSKGQGEGKATAGTRPPKASPKSGLGGVAGIMDSMENFKTAQQVGKMTNSLVQELASTTVEGTSVEGKVKVYFDGQQQPVGVKIDDAFLQDVDSASDLSAALTLAMKDAYRKSAERMDEKMKSFYVDLGLK